MNSLTCEKTVLARSNGFYLVDCLRRDLMSLTLNSAIRKITQHGCVDNSELATPVKPQQRRLGKHNSFATGPYLIRQSLFFLFL
jgi:hypothetical protein